jgi:hypothetical protein
MTEKTVDEIKEDAKKEKAKKAETEKAEMEKQLEEMKKQPLEIVEELKATMEIVKPTNASLFKKMAEVMAAVKRVPKNGWNKFHQYAATETDLLKQYVKY